MLCLCGDMSIQGSSNNGLTELDILKILGNDTIAERILHLLKKYYKSGIIPSKELDIEVLLSLEYFNLAFPTQSLDDSLSWDKRLSTIDDMEIPYIIRFFFKEICQNGVACWQDVVINYFNQIGESNVEDFIEIIQDILQRSNNLKISALEIVKISKKFNRDSGTLIAEMKGAGIISPKITFLKRKRSTPIYEINRFISLTW